MLRKDRDTLAAIAEVFEVALEGAVDGKSTGEEVMNSSADKTAEFDAPINSYEWMVRQYANGVKITQVSPNSAKGVNQSNLPAEALKAAKKQAIIKIDLQTQREESRKELSFPSMRLERM